MTLQPLPQPQPDLPSSDLTQILRPRLETLLQEVATLLAGTANSHPFGPTEFALRDLVQAATADLITTALQQKKTVTKARP